MKSHTRILAPVLLPALLLALTGCAAEKPEPAAEEGPPELIPIADLFGNPSKTRARLSPDGQSISYLAPSEEGALNVWVRDLDEQEARMVTNDTNRGIQIYSWAEGGQRILFRQDVGGDENFHVYSTDLETGETRDLTPFEGVRAQGVFTDRNHPGEILVELNLRDRRAFDVHRIDLETGEVVLDTENPGTVSRWLTDADFQVRGAWANDPATGGGVIRVRDSVDAPWRDLLAFDMEENGNLVMFSADGESLYVTTSLGSDTTRLSRVDLATREELEVLAQDQRSDVGASEIDDANHRIQAVRFDYLMPEWKVLDPAVADDFAMLGEQLPADFAVVSRDHADETWMISSEGDVDPLAYHLYDRATGSLEPLFVARPDLVGHRLAPMQPMVLEARDGMKLVAYLTLPLGVEPENLPLVLLVHGGPWSRDSWGYRSLPQLLANRGYAVLQVNFRASTGFGKAYLNAGNLEWGIGAMQHDLTDGAKWAIAEGIADPERVAIMGGSYGGYATLAGMVFTPELYACGVDVVGMSNMKTSFEAIPPYWLPFKKQLLRRVGDAESDDEHNRKISPLFHADKIRAPLLIGQGENDPRVKIRESDQIVAAMRGNELPVTYVVYPDEGHGFQRPPNRMDFWHRTDAFLAECLGGRSEPMPEIEGTTAELR